MQTKLLIVLGLVAILAFECGDSFWRRRHYRRRHHCSYSYKAHYYSILRHYHTVNSRYHVILRNYRILVNYIHHVGVKALRYGGHVTAIGRQLLHQYSRHHHISHVYGDEEDIEESDLFAEKDNDSFEQEFDDQNDDRDMVEDSEDMSENENEEDLKELPEKAEDVNKDHNLNDK
ncbi:uncharacterized protein LOC120341366 isoform X1 [Styela clava]